MKLGKAPIQKVISTKIIFIYVLTAQRKKSWCLITDTAGWIIDYSLWSMFLILKIIINDAVKHHLATDRIIEFTCPVLRLLFFKCGAENRQVAKQQTVQLSSYNGIQKKAQEKRSLNTRPDNVSHIKHAAQSRSQFKTSVPLKLVDIHSHWTPRFMTSSVASYPAPFIFSLFRQNL